MMKKTVLSICALLVALLPLELPAQPSPERSAVRIQSTVQTYSTGQPWQKGQVRTRGALGMLLEGDRVITTADVVADSTYVQLSNAEETRSVPAKVLAVDYEVNLALLGLGRESDKGIFEGMEPVGLAPAVGRGTALEVWQLAESGLPLISSGVVQGIDLLSTFVDGHYFLSYELKASLQSSSNSFTLPVMKGERLAGLLTGYDSGDQISNVLSSAIIARFIEDAKDGDYQGFPKMGLGTAETVDPFFREYLGLDETMGGLFVSRVVPKGIAERAGVKRGDVLLSVDGISVDRRGYYRDPVFDRLYWTHLVRGRKAAGEEVRFSLLRDGEIREVVMVLDPKLASETLVPEYTYDQAPKYLVHGGLVFQELTKTFLKGYGKDWTARAPLNLLEAIRKPDEFTAKGIKRVVVLSAVIPTPATLGYERIGGMIVTEVNGVKIEDMASLDKALRAPVDGVHRIGLDGPPNEIFVDEAAAYEVDMALRQRGLPQLKRL